MTALAVKLLSQLSTGALAESRKAPTRAVTILLIHRMDGALSVNNTLDMGREYAKDHTNLFNRLEIEQKQAKTRLTYQNCSKNRLFCTLMSVFHS